MAIEVNVPDIGDFTDVPVLTVLVTVGDTVSEEDPLIELESDKATMEVPSPAAGKVKEIKISEGDTVSEGTLIMVLEGEDAVTKNRDLMGATNPKDAEAGTIRADFAQTIDENAVHGSDSTESAAREVAYFFADEELCPRTR